MMGEVHTIRLRGPWLYEPLGRGEPQPEERRQEAASDSPSAGRVRVPCDLCEVVGADFRGLVRFRRGFGRPRGLEAGERVMLVVEMEVVTGEVRLNAFRLGRVPQGCGSMRHDVTALLKDRNELVVDVRCLPGEAPEGPRASGGRLGDVRLEIVSALASDHCEKAPSERP